MKGPRGVVERLGGEAHVWLLDAGRPLPPELIAAYRGLLSVDEAERYGHLRQSRVRREFLLGRALVRTTLSRYAQVEPVEWVFRATAHGRPEISGPAGHDELRFNLSHTRGMVACLVARGIEVGVDLEEIGRARRPLALATARFAPAEAAALRSLAASDLDEHFCFLWTLKEAYLKARGVGIALGLKRFGFALSERRDLQVDFDPGLQDREGDWQFALFEPSGKHVLALAIRRGAGEDLRIRVREVVPLTGEVRIRELPPVAATKPPLP
ncbi:MAG: 4'-phosphopantetheinyl transferase superfamily protein [Thermoanaerobaculia bacterium]